MLKNLGFFHRNRHVGGHYGVSEAEDGLLSAILRYSTWNKIIVWIDGQVTPDSSWSRADVRSSNSMIKDVSDGEVDAIHHVGLGPSTFGEVRGSKPIPVYTSVYPALSYNNQINAHILEYLSRKTNLDTNIFPTQCSREVVRRIYKQLADSGLVINANLKEEVIPIGVDTDLYAPLEEDERTEIRQREGIPREAIVAVVVSRFSPSDKADLLPLLRSVKYSRYTPAKEVLFVLVGGDRYFGARKYVQMLKHEVAVLGIQDQVFVRTVNERSRLVDLVRSANIFISPADSIQETFGITPIEAMSAGLPAIVSDWNGYRETVLDGQTGYLAKTTLFSNEVLWQYANNAANFRHHHLVVGQSVSVDTDDMVEKCFALADNPEHLSRMSTAARTHALKRYSWAKIIASYERLWEVRESARFLTDKTLQTTIDYAYVFRNYPTEIHHDGKVFELTPYGFDICQGKYRLPVFSDLIDFLSPDLICRVLGTFQQGSSSVLNLVMDLEDVDQDSIRFCVGWMTKNRIIRHISKAGAR